MLAPLVGAKSKIWQLFRFKVDALTKQQRGICHLCKGDLPYNGNMANLLYHLWISYMEEHKALKYRDYRDNFYMIIVTKHFVDTTSLVSIVTYTTIIQFAIYPIRNII